VLALAGVVVLAMIAVLLLGGAAVAKARAQTSADLAALAGAQAVLDGLGTAEACDQAASVVEAHRATMAACSISSDARCEVRVSVPSPLTLTGWASLTAKARAVAGRPP
jgi:secretion/DNA translocation related TadE-like protein